MTIIAMRLRNFRGFENAELPLRPLTVLIGPNSLGKACFCRALVALKLGYQPHVDLRTPAGWAPQPDGITQTAGCMIDGVIQAADSTVVSPVDATDGLRGIRYLKPNRFEPKRFYEPEPQYLEVIGAAGEGVPRYLLEHGEELVPSVTPPRCPTSPEQALQMLQAGSPWPGAEEKLTEKLVMSCGRWLKQLGLAERVHAWSKGFELHLDAGLPGQPDRPLTDVDFGISQVLPILVAGLILPEDGMLIVEHPEAHLHSMAQAELADFFCALVKTGRRALVATHSEAFFLRLRLRAALDPELARQIGVFFLHEPDEEGRCRQPEEVVLDEDEEHPWPEGFSSEGLDNALSMLAVRDALHKRRRER